MSGERRGRSAAEWATFAVSCLIVLAVVGAIAVQLRDGDRPADPRASAGAIRAVGRMWHVPVRVENRGDRTAAEVQVVVRVGSGPGAAEGEQVVDFLPGHDAEDLVFVFDRRPRPARIEATVASFREP